MGKGRKGYRRNHSHNYYENQAETTESKMKEVNKTTQSGGTYTTNYFVQQAPKKVFLFEGIEFWGSSKGGLEDVLLDESDLIINCSGFAFEHKLFVKKSPSWMKLELGPESEPHQLILDWKDYSPPPKSCQISFWKSIYEQARAKGIKRIFCCCTGGHGRTGTALASLILSFGNYEDPDEVIDFVRENYVKQAIEAKTQELYLWSLVYGHAEVFDKIVPSNNALVPTTSTNFSDKSSSHVPASKTSYNSKDKEIDEEGDDEAWEAWVKEWQYNGESTFENK